MVITLAILERRRSGILSTFTEELEVDDDDVEEEAIVKLVEVVVAIVLVTIGSDTMKKSIFCEYNDETKL